MVTELLVRNLEYLIDGLAFGVILGMLGLGITLVWGLGGVLNLAIGVFSVLGLLLALELMGVVQHLWLAVPLAMLGVGLVGLVVDRTLLSFVYRSEGDERILLGIFTTLGLAIAVDGLLTALYPTSYAIDAGVGSRELLGVLVRGSSIAVISVSAVTFLLLYLFIRRTYLGGAVRTVMQNETGAVLSGIDPRAMRTLVFVVSAAIAGLAGVLVGFTSQVDVAMSFELTINAVIVSVVGGVTSVPGTVLAGVMLGVVSVFTSAYIGAYVAEVVLLAVAVVALVARPKPTR